MRRHLQQMTDYDKIIVTYSEDMGCETFNQEIKISECAFKKKSQVISECFLSFGNLIFYFLVY